MPSSRRLFSVWKTPAALFTLSTLAFSSVAQSQKAESVFHPVEAQLIETTLISQDANGHAAWPTVFRQKDGTLLLVYSGGRDGHICPFGRVDLMVSKDEGKTWTWPRTILDSDLDDRDAGILETSKGTLIATTFTSLAYEPFLKAALEGKVTHFIAEKEKRDPLVTPDRVDAWLAAQNRLSPDQRKSMLGMWMIRSEDQGLTWSAPTRTPLNSPHGPVSLKDGRLMYPGKQLWESTEKIGVVFSDDDGKSWTEIAPIPTREGDEARHYHELHGVEADNGDLIVHLRNHNAQSHYETLQTVSKDGGKTWSTPVSTKVWGFPSHLMKCQNGDLIMTYGHRRAPFGNFARVSRDHGQTWSEPIPLSPDSNTADIGYPSTVELADGSLLTIWYEAMKPDDSWREENKGLGKTVLRQSRWRVSNKS